MTATERDADASPRAPDPSRVRAARVEARRVDAGGRFREVLEFFGDGPERLAGCTHVPMDEPVGGVVMCPSLFNEFLKNYRREVALARALAARGLAVQRFQYRGTGNSDGHPMDTSFETMCDDALAAAARLAEMTGIVAPAFVATRFGALVAASAARARPGPPVVLVEPVVEADRFFAEGFKNKLYTAGIRMKQEAEEAAKGGPRTVDDVIAVLEADGAVDVLGYTVSRALFRSSSGMSLAGLLGGSPASKLVVQLGGDQAVRPELARMAESLRRRGARVDVRQVGVREQWWLPEEREGVPGEVESRPHALDDEDPLVGLVGDWLRERLEPAP